MAFPRHMRRRRTPTLQGLSLLLLLLSGSSPVPGDAAAAPAPEVIEYQETAWVPSPMPEETMTTVPASTTTTMPPSMIFNSGTFGIAPNQKLPSEKECAKQVKKVKETKPANTPANRTKPGAIP